MSKTLSIMDGFSSCPDAGWPGIDGFGNLRAPVTKAGRSRSFRRARRGAAAAEDPRDRGRAPDVVTTAHEGLHGRVERPSIGRRGHGALLLQALRAGCRPMEQLDDLPVRRAGGGRADREWEHPRQEPRPVAGRRGRATAARHQRAGAQRDTDVGRACPGLSHLDPVSRLGAGEGCDAGPSIAALRFRSVTPHVAIDIRTSGFGIRGSNGCRPPCHPPVGLCGRRADPPQAPQRAAGGPGPVKLP